MAATLVSWHLISLYNTYFYVKNNLRIRIYEHLLEPTIKQLSSKQSAKFAQSNVEWRSSQHSAKEFFNLEIKSHSTKLNYYTLAN